MQVRVKFRGKIDEAAKIRQDFFARTYGKTSKEDIIRVNQAFVTELLKGINVNIAFCQSLKYDLARQLDEGWAYLWPRMEEGYRRGETVGRACERV